MKAQKMFCTGLLFAGSLAFLTGCTDNDLNNGTLPPPLFNNGPNTVNFTAGLANATRIAYGHENGQAETTLKWESSDNVIVFSPTRDRTSIPPVANEIHHPDDQYGYYHPVDAAGNNIVVDNAAAYFGFHPNTGLGAVKWKVEVGEKQDFHAFSALNTEVLDENIVGENIQIQHDHVYTQLSKVQDSFSPQGLLYANAGAHSNSNEVGVERSANPNQVIDFHFKQLFNRLDIHITKPEDMTIQMVRVSSKTKDLAGDLEATIIPNFDATATSAFTLTNPSKTVYYVLGDEYEDDGEVDVVVWLLPNEYSDLEITVVVDEENVLEGEEYLYSPPKSITRRISKTIPARSRHIVNFGYIYSDLLVTEDNHEVWMDEIDDETPISNLTIPGAIGAGTEVFYTQTEDRSNKRVQLFSVTDLFLKGVRAFEFPRIQTSTTDKKLYVNDYGATTNAKKPGQELSTQIQAIADMVKSFPSETAVVIAYFGHDGQYTADRAYTSERSKFCELMKAIIQPLISQDRCILYREDLTLGECRGKIIFLSPDEVFTGKEMGWDYYTAAAPNTLIDNNSTNSYATGRTGGKKDMRMLGAQLGNDGENLNIQRQALLKSNDKEGREEKINNVISFFQETSANTWVFNYLLATGSNPASNNKYTPADFIAGDFYTTQDYQDDKVPATADLRNSYQELTGEIMNIDNKHSLGFIMMAYAGVAEHKFTDHPEKRQLNGDQLLNAVIRHNLTYLDLNY